MSWFARARYSGIACHVYLVRGRERDAPGSIPKLALKHLRTHRGLAVGAERNPGTPRKFGDPFGVVGKGRFFQNCQRQRHLLPQNIPSLLRNAFDRKRDRAPGYPLGPMRQGDLLGECHLPIPVFSVPPAALKNCA